MHDDIGRVLGRADRVGGARRDRARVRLNGSCFIFLFPGSRVPHISRLCAIPRPIMKASRLISSYKSVSVSELPVRHISRSSSIPGPILKACCLRALQKFLGTLHFPAPHNSRLTIEISAMSRVAKPCLYCCCTRPPGRLLFAGSD